MEISFRPATQEEKRYCVAQSANLVAPSGMLYRVAGELGDHFPHWSSCRIKPDKDDAIWELLSDAINIPEGSTSVLGNLNIMRRYCESHPECFYHAPDGIHGYCYTAWTESFAYMMLLNPNKRDGNYQYSIICYLRAAFERHMETAREGIRFIDQYGIPAFRIDDGDSICIKDPNGKRPPVVLSCRLTYRGEIDVGGMLYTVEEFASVLNGMETRVIPMRATLPDKCFGFDADTRRLVEIHKGETSMVTSKLNTANQPEKNEQFADSYNHCIEVTKAQSAAMLYGCTHGWELDRADPANYDADGNYLKN